MCPRDFWSAPVIWLASFARALGELSYTGVRSRSPRMVGRDVAWGSLARSTPRFAPSCHVNIRDWPNRIGCAFARR